MIVNKYLKIYIDDLKYKQKGDHIMEYVTLNNGLKMPMVGFGTMNIFDEEECTKILKEAYEEGYRLFDCAQIYGNEQIVGSALRKAGIPRDEIFLTTKVWFTNFEGE